VPFMLRQIFKWEERKAWDVLLAAYLEEFAPASASRAAGAQTPVALYLLTQPYHSSSDFASKMHAWARQALGVAGELHERCCPLPACATGCRSCSNHSCKLHALCKQSYGVHPTPRSQGLLSVRSCRRCT
jgi:hypothetical protein